ncbi:hypothetical protein BPAE_0016g00560 [Botrytis paeoniae]|uniref:Uncharacterized protein n=1 Tax=Botrytis paeoniae TaxID=278948 RepID=A0A4Z1G1T0_9HELO|nr:hypothetical protein BPAE_0016g00560 [Botrytis paeoniae]
MHGQNSNSYDEHGNIQNNYTGFPPNYIPPNNPPSQNSHSNQRPSQHQLLESSQQQQPFEGGQENFGQHNSLERRQLHQPLTFVQQQVPYQYLTPQPSSKPHPYSLPPIQSSQLQSMPQSQPSRHSIGLDVMISFKTQSQSSVQSHPQMPTDSSSDSMQNFEMSAMSEVEKSQQDIMPNTFGAQASPQNDASGQDTHRLSKSHLGSTETIENGTKRDLVSAFRDRLLSRSYFCFRWNRDLEHILSIHISEALNDVHIAIGQLWPTFSKSDIKLAHSMLINMQYQDSSMAKRPVSGIADSIGIQPLLNHIYSTGKKAVLMSRGKGKNSDRVYKSYFYFPVETEERNQVHAPLKIPIYIYGISESFGARNRGDIFEVVGQASKDKDDQILRAVMEDLSCKANDIVLMRNNVHDTEPMTLDGILLVDIQTDIQTGGTTPPALYFTHGMRYEVNSHTTLTRILAGELVEDAFWRNHR